MSPSRGTVDAAVAAGRIYVADGQAGLLVPPTLPNVQFTVHVDATPNETFTLQATTNLTAPHLLDFSPDHQRPRYALRLRGLRREDGFTIEQTSLALTQLQAREAVPVLKVVANHHSMQTRMWVLQAIGI